MSCVFPRGRMLTGLLPVVAIAPLVSVQIAQAQTTFSDVNDTYWAKPFIETLAAQNIIKGFPDGSFKPNQPVTRAQFAALVRQAFSNTAPTRQPTGFRDVASSYWASPAIDHAFGTGFLSGYTDGTFRPEQNIPKVQALVALASGLKLQPGGDVDGQLRRYSDAAQIPNYAKNAVAAATERRIPVNYPNIALLRPNQSATRADIAAFMYQALVNQGRLQPLASNVPGAQYIVQGGSPAPVASGAVGRWLPRGTEIPVTLPGNQAGNNVVMAPGETVDVNFVVAQDVLNRNNELVILKGSQLKGQFVPASGSATQYRASELVVGNSAFPLNAQSDPIAARQRSAFNLNQVTGSLSTVAASALLRRTFGQRLSIGSLLPDILQTGQSVLTRPASSNDNVILVEPNNMKLRLASDFRFANTASTTPTPVTNPSSTAVVPSNLVSRGTRVGLVPQVASQRFVMLPGESVPVELKLQDPLLNAQNQILVPAGSIVRGDIVTTSLGGSQGGQFVARDLVIGSKTYPITAATSGVASRSLTSLRATDFQGNVVVTPNATTTLRNLQRAAQSSGGGLLGNLLGGNNRSSSDRVIIFDPAATQLEFGAPLTLPQ